MEKINSKSIVFKFVFSSFLISFILFIFLNPDGAVPSLNDIMYALLSPFEETVNPLDDIIDSLNAIKAFAISGELPTLENLLDLFLAPFAIVGNLISVIVQMILNLVELFK